MTIFTAIDLTRLPPPDIIETLDFEAIVKDTRDDLVARFPLIAGVIDLESEPARKLIEAFAYRELGLRARVNDAARAVLAPLSSGADLDNVAARVNIVRLDGESDERLRLRYLLAFDAPSAGSADRYLYEAYTAWPDLHHAAVIGRSIHGRRGDVDVVITGPGGMTPSTAEMTLVRDAVTAAHVKPEATAVTVVAATRLLYDVSLRLDVARGPDPSAVRAEAEARVMAAAAERLTIGGEVPAEAIAGAAYGAGVIKVTRLAPSGDIAPSPYTIPIMSGITIATEVRA